MIEILCSKSSISADTAFRKFNPAGVTKKQPPLDQPRKNQIKTQRGLHDKAITRFRNISGGHPLSRSRNGVSKLRDGLKVCDNGCERLGTPNGACRHRVITPLPKQYSVQYLAQS